MNLDGFKGLEQMKIFNCTHRTVLIPDTIQSQRKHRPRRLEILAPFSPHNRTYVVECGADTKRHTSAMSFLIFLIRESDRCGPAALCATRWTRMRMCLLDTCAYVSSSLLVFLRPTVKHRRSPTESLQEGQQDRPGLSLMFVS